MKRYAQINKNGYVISDSYLSDIVHLPNMILLEAIEGKVLPGVAAIKGE